MACHRPQVEKKLPISVEAKRRLIEPNHPYLSIPQQCELLDLNRATFYYQPAGETALMRLIDEQYTQTPFYGWLKMTIYLQKLGYPINHKRIQRLMQVMGLQAVGPKPGTSRPAPEHKIYPYLLRGLTITRPNQVRSDDGRPFGRLVNIS
jgi:putative transposase